jgi:hypothetical protein
MINEVQRPGAMGHRCDPSTQEAETGGSRVWGQSGLHSDFQASLDYITRCCHKMREREREREREKEKEIHRVTPFVEYFLHYHIQLISSNYFCTFIVHFILKYLFYLKKLKSCSCSILVNYVSVPTPLWVLPSCQSRCSHGFFFIVYLKSFSFKIMSALWIFFKLWGLYNSLYYLHNVELFNSRVKHFPYF